jgi:protoporphyrinogen oxidase
MAAGDSTGTLIVGAGVAGLGAGVAARERGLEFQVVEGSERPGGLVQTDELDGFRFDRTAHVLHFRSSRIEQDFRGLGVKLGRIRRRAAVVLNGRLVPYPLQYNLWALGDSDLARSLVDELALVAARPPATRGSFADLLLSTWGEGLVSMFLRPYNEKLWGRPLTELPAECAGDYLPHVDLDLARAGASAPVEYEGYNGDFLYPLSGRLGDVADELAEPIRKRIHCGETVVALDLDVHEAYTSEWRTIGYERLVGTAPLPVLLEAAGVLDGHAGLFDATSVANVRIALRGKMRTPLHWLYVPDSNVPFHRISFPRNISAFTCPAECASLSVEYTLPRRGSRTSAQDVADAALGYVADLGLIDVEGVYAVSETVISPAYVVQRAPTREEFSEIAQLLVDRDVHLAGRFGTWDYLSIEQAFASGMHAVEEATHA